MATRKLIFGRPGSGKTTLMTKEIIDSLDDGIIVFSNVKVNWFGKLFLMDKFTYFVNSLVKFFLSLIFLNRKKQLEKISIRLSEIRETIENMEWHFTPEGQEIPNIDLTDLYFESYNLKEKRDKLQNIDKIIKNGLIGEYYYPPQNFNFSENLEETIQNVLDIAEKAPETRFLLAWDEGFIDLEHGAKVPRYVTNFLNQSRKLNVDVTIASQRPVAVYPSFRALCDYMIKCQPARFGKIEGRLYWVDTKADALPDLSVRFDADGRQIDESEHYTKFKGKKVFPFFDSYQSIALKRLFEGKSK